ncbi:MAG: IMP cyclohydrolase [Oscillospiraceae bacterium]|jgi:IMP cyclohydrolase|nr:IMP cyclohydrolase [Oscillospiraceae bacterium]
MKTIGEAVARTPYPGRGIVLGRNAYGTHAMAAYFIMGRSENSRNRVFIPEGEGIRTQAHDPAKLTDPSLVIYAPMRVLGHTTIVTNGDQTDTIYNFLLCGDSFESALRTRTFEPDPPIYTPRISGIITRRNGDFFYKLALLKSDGGDSSACLRYFYEYETPLAGQGHLLHTYCGTGDVPTAFTGEPETVSMGNNVDEVAESIWNGLNPDNKIALFVRSVRLSDGQTRTRVINKYGEKGLQ